MAAGKISILSIGVMAIAAIADKQAVTAAGGVAAAGANAVGFAESKGAIGERVPVSVVGTGLAVAGGAIALGAAVEVGAAGKVVTKAAGVTIGRALSAAAADGQTIEVLIIPN